MWYFAWVLGLAFASTFAILNAIWYEVHSDRAHGKAEPFRAP